MCEHACNVGPWRSMHEGPKQRGSITTSMCALQQGEMFLRMRCRLAIETRCSCLQMNAIAHQVAIMESMCQHNCKEFYDHLMVIFVVSGKHCKNIIFSHIPQGNGFTNGLLPNSILLATLLTLV
jgi:hypothetical protein